MRKILLLVIMGLLSGTLFSQELNNSEGAEGNKSYFNGKVNYTTNSLYFGRSDSIVTPFSGINFTYNHKSGIFLDGTLNFFPNRTVSILDMGSISAGYNYNLFNDKLSGSIGYSRYFYSQYSTQVGSVIKGTLSLGFYLDLNIVQLSMGAYLNHGDKKDVKINPGISRGFEIKKFLGSSLKITPTATLFAGTQNLMGVYILQRPGKIKNIYNKKGKHGSTNTTGKTTTISTNYSKFNFLSLDVSLPLNYSIKAYTFNFTATYSIPFNVQDGEFTHNPFFMDFSIGVKF